MISMVGYHEYTGVFSTAGDYHEYTGGDTKMYVGVIMSTPGECYAVLYVMFCMKCYRTQ